MTANEHPTADPMPEPTPDRAVGEISDEELVDAFEGAIFRSDLGTGTSYESVYEAEGEADACRAELLRRLAAATADPMPEPTPDRAVVDELREAIDNLEDASYRYAKTGEDDWGNLMVKWRVTVNDLLARLAATERPADGTVIEIARSQIPALSDALCWGIEHIENEIEQMPVGEDRDDLFNDLDGMIQLRDDLQQQCNAALSAASDGGDCE